MKVYDIRPCKENTEFGCINSNVSEEEAQFWGVYGCIENPKHNFFAPFWEHIADFNNREDAEIFVKAKGTLLIEQKLKPQLLKAQNAIDNNQPSLPLCWTCKYMADSGCNESDCNSINNYQKWELKI